MSVPSDIRPPAGQLHVPSLYATIHLVSLFGSFLQVVSRHSMRHSITSMRNRFLKMFSTSSQLNSTVSVEAK